MERLGHNILKYIIESLGIPYAKFCADINDPTILFQIFNYPVHDPNLVGLLGVGEHTDYGYITVLYQDNSGGLQIKSKNGTWIDVVPMDGTFVVNLGDALEHSTGGLLRATPHRVGQRIDAAEGRLSFPFFFDPNFDSPM
jgi:isopenicillin N synthase-like dioxygenase